MCSTNQCVGSGITKFCFGIANFTVDATGCCGCLNSAATLGPIQISDQIGCFAFGTGTNCPNTDCSIYSSCTTCNIFPQCGYCYDQSTGTGACMEGTQTGPVNGTCSKPNIWVDHLNQCHN